MKLSIDSKKWAIRSTPASMVILINKLARDSRLIKIEHLPDIQTMAKIDESGFDLACAEAWDKWDR
jgi:hypothetical protein